MLLVVDFCASDSTGMLVHQTSDVVSQLFDAPEGDYQKIIENLDAAQDGAAEKQSGDSPEGNHQVEPTESHVSSVLHDVRRLKVEIDGHVVPSAVN